MSTAQQQPANAMLLRVIRTGIASLLVVAGLIGLLPAGTASENGSTIVYRVKIESTINPGTLELLKHAIQTAETNQAVALIVSIDTPGGLLSSTRDMVSAISEAKIPIIGYVGPAGANAGSAGAFILLASHIAVMNNGTNVGASTPVSGEGQDIKGDLGKKILNDSKAFMRSLAEQRGKNIEMAEKFVSQAMSLSAKEAYQNKIIDAVVDNPEDLLAAVDGRTVVVHGTSIQLNTGGAKIRDVAPRAIDFLLIHLAHPQIAHLLLSFGLLAIYIEIISPGLGFPGILGAIAVVLGMVCVQTLPVNTGFLILLILGAVLMTAEYFVSGFGALGIGGALAFVFGSLYLFDSPSSSDYQSGVLSISIGISAAMVLTSVLITHSIISKPRKTKLIGKTGEAMMNFDKKGFVLLDGERWPAVTMDTLHHGDNVLVIDMRNNDTVVVRKTEHDKPA